MTWLNILNKEEVANIGNFSRKENRFQLDFNEAIYVHLTDMYCKFVQITGRLIVNGEELIFGHEILTLIELLESENKKLNKIFLDEWEFCRNPIIVKTVDGKEYSPSNF